MMNYRMIYSLMFFISLTHVPVLAQEGSVIDFEFESPSFDNRVFEAKVFLPEGENVTLGMGCNIPVVIYLHGSQSTRGIVSDDIDRVFEAFILPGMAEAIDEGTDEKGYEFTPMVVAAIKAINQSEPTYHNRHIWYDDPAGRNDGPFETLVKEFADHVAASYCNSGVVYGLGHSMGGDAVMRIGATRDWLHGGVSMSPAGANWRQLFFRVRQDASQVGISSIGQDFDQRAGAFGNTSTVYALWGVATTVSPLTGDVLEACKEHNVQVFAEIEAGTEPSGPVLPCAEFPFYMDGSNEIATVYEEKWLPNLDLLYMIEHQIGELFPLYFDWGDQEQFTRLPPLNISLLNGPRDMGYVPGVDFEYKIWADGENDKHDMAPTRLKVAFQFLNRVAKGAITTGLEKPQKRSLEDLQLYPNPAADHVYVRIPGSISSSLTLEMFDVLGRRIQRLTIENPSAMSGAPLKIDVSQQSPGVYYLRFISGDGRSLTKPFGVQ